MYKTTLTQKRCNSDAAQIYFKPNLVRSSRYKAHKPLSEKKRVIVLNPIFETYFDCDSDADDDDELSQASDSDDNPFDYSDIVSDKSVKLALES